jgi:8-oxo-dGTP pyrophosphatase MutT (NUDIX family)
LARLKTALAVSSGGVVYRILDERIQVVLCGRLAKQIWGLPKGTPLKGEDLIQTAIREVREETGLDVRVLEPIGQIEYWFVARGVRFHKTVHYYLMQPTGGDLSRHDPEYDVVHWFDLDDALRQMSYRNEADIVRKAGELIRRQEECPLGEAAANALAEHPAKREGGK